MTTSTPIDKLDHEHLGKRITLEVDGARDFRTKVIGVLQCIIIKDHGTTVYFEGKASVFFIKDADVTITLHTDSMGR